MKNTTYITIIFVLFYILSFVGVVMSQIRLNETQKPVALIEYLIKTYTQEGETVLDFTMGSGTTAIACLNTNRNYIGFEMDKGYFDIAQERITTHYGKIQS